MPSPLPSFTPLDDDTMDDDIVEDMVEDDMTKEEEDEIYDDHDTSSSLHIVPQNQATNQLQTPQEDFASFQPRLVSAQFNEGITDTSSARPEGSPLPCTLNHEVACECCCCVEQREQAVTSRDQGAPQPGEIPITGNHEHYSSTNPGQNDGHIQQYTPSRLLEGHIQENAGHSSQAHMTDEPPPAPRQEPQYIPPITAHENYAPPAFSPAPPTWVVPPLHAIPPNAPPNVSLSRPSFGPLATYPYAPSYAPPGTPTPPIGLPAPPEVLNSELRLWLGILMCRTALIEYFMMVQPHENGSPMYFLAFVLRAIIEAIIIACNDHFLPYTGNQLG
ncbi:hypothetical protein M422DRAFT_265207 [Sphaerobolus stellatus SS14]|uniref:Unplaced genomic scaffold SPHSTscaffold_145, whole genome shotgun sequence n=1 Tax=Sphaerobolus stellatus (strain SS14) TaxID=990650 RepID=A0A0C9UDU0_SPHS4|nr:hypothetical protein M422DRAFT_265207 [Sphaerobolus stellatus SS14]